MPNPYCECKTLGYCTRHKMRKGQRAFQSCKGIADSKDCGLGLWNSWEQGLLGSTLVESPKLDPEGFCRDVVSVNDPPRIVDCIHRQEEIEKIRCGTCSGKVLIKKFGCDIHKECTIYKQIAEIKCCYLCEDVTTELPTISVNSNVAPLRKYALKWAYGVTTVQERIDDLLPRTLKSLTAAGFDQPRLFVDGCKDASVYDRFGLEVTTRYPTIRTHGNWILSAYELYIRNPDADRYVLFQDDFVTYKNLREYLEKSEYPSKGYCNLYTFPENQKLCPEGFTGWFRASQRGRGAVALMFTLEAIIVLLNSAHMLSRPQSAKRGWRAVDGGIVDSFKKANWREYTHNPSLVQHTGDKSVMGNKRHATAPSFQGEDFDALSLLPKL